MSNFDNVPVDKDTKIQLQQEMKLGEYETLYQKWYWDGITAESIIFSGEDANKLDDQAITDLVRSSTLVKKNSSITIKRSDSEFIFVNFNFVTE